MSSAGDAPHIADTSPDAAVPASAPQPPPVVRRMLFGASATAILQGASSAISFLVAVLLARLLGSTGYGAYAFALAWVSVLTIPAGLGLYRFVVQGVAIYETNERWDLLKGLLLRANTLVLTVSSVIATLGCAVALTTLAPSLRWVFAIGMLLIPINALVILRQGAMQALGRIITAQIPEYLIRPIILLGGVGFLAFAGRQYLTPIAAMVVNVSAVTVAFVVGLISLRRALPSQVHDATPRYHTREWVTAALPMMLIAGIWQLNGYVSTIIVGSLGGPQEAGIYSAVEKGGEIIVLLLLAANMPFAPAIARMRAKGDLSGLEHAAERIAQATLIAAIPIAAFFVIVPGAYLSIFGSSFVSGSTALRILALAQLFNAAAGPVGSVLIMTGHQRAASWGVGAGLLTTVIVSIALVPLLGVTGAAIGDAASFIVWNATLIVMCRRLVVVNATAFGRFSMTAARQ